MQTWCTEKSLAWLHEEGLQLKLCHMLCFSEIMKLRFQLCELIGQTFCPIWCPKMLRLDTTAPRTGASVCRLWYSGLMTQTAWQYKFQHNRMFHTFVYVDCWCEIWRPCSIALEDIHSSSWRQVDIWDGHWVPCSKSAFSNQRGRFDLVMKIQAFWDVMLCVWVHSWHFEESLCLTHQELLAQWWHGNLFQKTWIIRNITLRTASVVWSYFIWKLVSE